MTLISITTDKPPFYDDAKDASSSFSGDTSRESWSNSPFLKIHSMGTHFRDEREFELTGLPEGTRFSLGSDGIGTKVVLHDTLGKYRNAARDLLSMGLDDVARFGGIPLALTNVVDVQSLSTSEQKHAYQELMRGLAEVAKEQDVVILGGETATLGELVGSPNPEANLAFNWSASIFGASHPKLRISPENVKAGDIIVALKQDGFRSNGISLVRRAFKAKFGAAWYTEAPRELIEQAAAPSVPYAKLISFANGWYSEGEKFVNITSVAHLSGGSFQSKFLEGILLKNGLSATLNGLFPIPEIALKCREWLIDKNIMTLEELFTNWCCGQGMLVTFPNIKEAEVFIRIAEEKFGIEAKVAGQITETPKGKNSSITIHI